jgi:carbonic anhydrase
MSYIKGTAAFAYRFSALLIFVAGCAVEESRREEVSTKHWTETHWGYEGDIGPEVWGELCPKFTICSNGDNQSPIDITGANKKALTDITFDYKPTTLNILHNGHTVQVNYDEGSYIEIDGMGRYELKQFHFHAPSEHTLDGKHFTKELHFVHQNADGELAVVGVWVEEGSHNHALLPLSDYLPADAGDEFLLNHIKFSADDLLPSKRYYYHYDGSLTTPPCTEGVKWFVLTTPIQMSDSQIASFKAIIKNNNRPVQPQNNRKVLVDASVN